MIASRTLIGNRFEIADPEQDLLGRGGVGDVYRGRDLQTGELVAVKALRPEVVAGDPNALARFLREGEALRQLDHPNIVRMVDGMEEGGRHYLVMEYVPGGSLRDLLEGQGRLSVERTVEIALDVADALTRAHRLGILHRDLKPSNVLLAEDGTPRLTDFGHAHLTTGPRLTQSGTVVGTVLYLSPEACNGETLDARADIWAFGVMLYEMLTGQVPFPGETFPAVFMAILSQPVPDLGQFRPEVPDALTDLVYRMLEKDRAARIPSVRLVGAELEAMLEGAKLQVTGWPVAGPGQSPAVSRFARPTPAAEPLKHNLPVQPTPFVGREAELEELDKLLADPGVRLVTVLGIGGMGKTRLALEAAARQLGRYPHGVYWVSLAPLRSVEAILPTVAEALGFAFYGVTVPPREQLLDYLRQKRLLLVLDNYEHLLEGADLVSDILRVAPEVRILATSRASLKVQEEHLYHVGGMDFPDWETPEDALEYSAIKLFMQSVRRVRPGFELQANDLRYVYRICRLVQGMPLGILLAAAWVEMLSPEEIAHELMGEEKGQKPGLGLDFLNTDLRDVPERQRSMRAVFDYSWSLLPEGLQLVVEALSVFRGGFTRAAAQEVTGASLRDLMALVNRSLLRRLPTGRYEIHELLRQYAAEKLSRSPDTAEAVRDRYAACYAAALARWSREIRGPRQQAALGEMDVEWDNVRAAWQSMAKQGQAVRLGQGVDGLGQFCLWRRRTMEGDALFRIAAQGLSASGTRPSASTADRLRALSKVLAWRAWLQDFEAGQAWRELLQESLALLDRPELADVDTRSERAFVLQTMAWLGFYPEHGRSRQVSQQSLALYEGLGDRASMARVLESWGWSAGRHSHLEEAVQHYERSVAISESLGDQLGRASCLLFMSWCLIALGQFERAERCARESLAIREELLNVPGDGQETVGWAIAHRGRFREARPLIERAVKGFDERGTRAQIAIANSYLGVVEAHLGRYDEARDRGQRGLDSFRLVGWKEQSCFSLAALGMAALGAEAYQEAVQLLEQSTALYDQTPDRHWRAWALALSGYTALRLGHRPQAKDHLRQALRFAVETRAALSILYALPGAALLHIDVGEVERAVELYALASRYPFVAHSRWFEDVAGGHIAPVAASLPLEVGEAAKERGRARDLWTTVGELLAELEG